MKVIFQHKIVTNGIYETCAVAFLRVPSLAPKLTQKLFVDDLYYHCCYYYYLRLALLSVLVRVLVLLSLLLLLLQLLYYYYHYYHCSCFNYKVQFYSTSFLHTVAQIDAKYWHLDTSLINKALTNWVKIDWLIISTHNWLLAYISFIKFGKSNILM